MVQRGAEGTDEELEDGIDMKQMVDKKERLEFGGTK